MLDYINGNLSEKERIAFEERIKESPALRKEVDDLRVLLRAMDDIEKLRQVNTDSRWKKMSREVSFLNLKHRIKSAFGDLSVFSFIPLLLLIIYLGLRLSQSDRNAGELIEVQSAHGLVSKILLPDSSVVYLNSGSRLTYPTRFTEKVRTVSLKGEAYFVVKACPEKRFEVRTSADFLVSAYGTEFNVNADDGLEWVSTVLVKGNIVANIHERPGLVINPGQRVVYNKSTKDVKVADVNPYVATAWKDGKIVFRRAKMPEIAYRLSKHYNVDIELEDKVLEQYEFSATFTTESLTEILDLISKASHIRWRCVEPLQLDDGSYTKRKVIMSLG